MDGAKESHRSFRQRRTRFKIALEALGNRLVQRERRLHEAHPVCIFIPLV